MTEGLFQGSISGRLYSKAIAADPVIPMLMTEISAVGMCPSRNFCKTRGDECPSQGAGCGRTRTGDCATEQCTPGVTKHPKCKD